MQGNFSQNCSDAVEQITIKTSSGVKTRVDAIGLDTNGNDVIQEYKSSLTAPLTNNQARAFQEIFENGGIYRSEWQGNTFCDWSGVESELFCSGRNKDRNC